MLLFLSALAGAAELPRLLNFGPSASISLLLLWKPMTCTELLWATVEAGGAEYIRIKKYHRHRPRKKNYRKDREH